MQLRNDTFDRPIIQWAVTAAVFSACLGVSVANAGEPQPIGDQTRHWIDLQASGTVASPEERPLPGEIAERSFERYAESFSQPIPDTFEREGFLSDSGGD